MLKRPFIFLTLIFFVSAPPVVSQFAPSLISVDAVEAKSAPKRNRSNGVQMLRQIKKVLKANYYDKNLRGIDVDARFKSAEEKIKTLDTNGEIFRVIATELMEFNDSHTRFFPPGRANRVEYGFVMQMIGKNCFVTSVKKGSDAESKELRAGDRIIKIGQYDVTRDSLWALNYLLYSLEPLPVVPITIINANGEEKRLVIESKITPFKEALADEKKRRRSKEEPFKCSKLSGELIACKLTTFSVDKKIINRMMEEASGHTKMILDLRGNRGGYVSINEYLTGHFFDKEIKIGEMITRKKTHVRKARPVRSNNFAGELIVLVDSNSASASEVFARVIQIEKRGRVVGDVSAGAVMTSIQYPLGITRGVDVNLRITPFMVNITIGDLVMSDGSRLEAIGVIPDHPVGPTPYALLNGSDPVLSYAAGLLNVALSPDDAGKLDFMIEHDEDEEPEEDEETAQK